MKESSKLEVALAQEPSKQREAIEPVNAGEENPDPYLLNNAMSLQMYLRGRQAYNEQETDDPQPAMLAVMDQDQAADRSQLYLNRVIAEDSETGVMDAVNENLRMLRTRYEEQEDHSKAYRGLPQDAHVDQLRAAMKDLFREGRRAYRADFLNNLDGLQMEQGILGKCWREVISE